MRLLTSIAFSGFVAASTFFGGAAQAFSGPWTDCAFVRPNQSVKSVNCRVSQTFRRPRSLSKVPHTFQVLHVINSRLKRPLGGKRILRGQRNDGLESGNQERFCYRGVVIISWISQRYPFRAFNVLTKTCVAMPAGAHLAVFEVDDETGDRGPGGILGVIRREHCQGITPSHQYPSPHKTYTLPVMAVFC